MTESEKSDKIDAALKAAADKALLLDHDWLKIVDTSKLTLQADGSVKGADELMTALKEAKPYIFGKPKMAKDMTPAERDAKWAELRKGPAPQPMPMDKRASQMTKAEREAWLKEHNRRFGW